MGDTQANQRKKTRGEDYIAQGSILAVAVVITKIIGVVYRIPLTNILGDEGNGFYGYAYQVYAIALMLSSLSLPTAVSKLVSVRMAVGQRRNAFRVFLCSLIFAVSVGIIISLAIFLGAGAISEHMMKAPFSVYALKVLSPGLLIVAVMAVLRGYFQGLGTMVPTAVSQIIEQIINGRCPPESRPTFVVSRSSSPRFSSRSRSRYMSRSSRLMCQRSPSFFPRR